MRNAECGVRNGACERRLPWPAPAIEPSPSTPHSAFRIPHLVVGVITLAVFAAACQRDGRTPLVIYSPHGRDLLTLLEQGEEIAAVGRVDDERRTAVALAGGCENRKRDDADDQVRNAECGMRS